MPANLLLSPTLIAIIFKDKRPTRRCPASPLSLARSAQLVHTTERVISEMTVTVVEKAMYRVLLLTDQLWIGGEGVVIYSEGSMQG